MSFESLFIPWLAEQSSLVVLMSSRMYPAHAPDAVAKPYVVWHHITGDAVHTHTGTAFREHRIQFSIFADTLASAVAVRDALLALLDGKRLTISGLTEVTSFLDSFSSQYEKDTKVHHIPVDFTVSYAV